jgi:hypothetical protein
MSTPPNRAVETERLLQACVSGQCKPAMGPKLPLVAASNSFLVRSNRLTCSGALYQAMVRCK